MQREFERKLQETGARVKQLIATGKDVKDEVST